MSKFINKLQELIEKNNIPPLKVARSLNVTKMELPLIYDETIKISAENFASLVSLLELEFLEVKELEQLFRIYLVGEHDYTSRSKIREFIDQITIYKDYYRKDKFCFDQDNQSKGGYFEGTYHYESRIALILAIKRVVGWSLCNDDSTAIKLVYDIKDEFILAYFYELYTCYDVDLTIEHITTLNSFKRGDVAINILMYLIPMVITSKRNYQCFYNNDIAKLVAGDFSNYMIINDKMFIFSDDLANGLLITDYKQVDLFRRKFDRSRGFFKPLVYQFGPDSGYEDIYQELISDPDIYSIEPGLYINNYLDREMIAKYYLRADDTSEAAIDHMINFLQGETPQNSFHVAASLEGFGEFMKNGINISLPPFGDTCFTRADRLKIMTDLIEDLKTGRYDLNLINTDIISFPRELIIIPSLTKGVIISFAADFKFGDTNFAFYIDDAQIGKQFCDFIDSMKSEGLAFGLRDTIVVLKQLMNLYLED